MHNTGNPLGSTQVLDLYDNSEVVDQFTNSQQDEIPDRFGVKRLTLAGLIKRSMSLRNEINDFSGAMTFKPEWTDVPMNVSEGVGGEGGALNLQAEALGNRSEINKITSREALRRTYLEAGYNLVDGSFETGGVLNNATDVLLQDRTGKAFSGPAGAVASGTSPASGSFVDRSGELLRAEFLRRDGDVRGWGAKLDGVTYDDVAFSDAIAATGGKITVRGPALLSTNVVITDLSEPCVTFEGAGKIAIDQTFSFDPSFRGIIAYRRCHNPRTVNPVITGARIDKMSAAQPWEDGDAGIEYMDCTGVCKTIDPVLSDFKTWGVIHINVDGYMVTNPIIHGCLVQSGIGGTGVKRGSITNPDMEWIGLYGIEIETVAQNKLISVTGGRVSRALKAAAIIDNSDDIVISDLVADRCRVGFSSTSSAANRSFMSGVSHNCLFDVELVGCSNATCDVVQTSDLATTEFIRTRSYDYIVRVSGDVAYIPNRPEQPANLTVGRVLLIEPNTQKTITEILGDEVDPLLGTLMKVRTSPAITSEDARKLFLRQIDIGSGGRYLVMYDGGNNTVKGGSIRKKAAAIESYGAHDNFIWDGVKIRDVDTLIIQGSSGTASGRVSINASDVISVGSAGSTAKFATTFSETKEFQISSSALGKTQSLHVPGGVIGKISVTLNDDVTSSGTVVLKFNGANTINFSAGAKRGSALVNVAVGTDEVIKVSLVDTIGDISGSGYSVTLYGAFTK